MIRPTRWLSAFAILAAIVTLHGAADARPLAELYDYARQLSQIHDGLVRDTEILAAQAGDSRSRRQAEIAARADYGIATEVLTPAEAATAAANPVTPVEITDPRSSGHHPRRKRVIRPNNATHEAQLVRQRIRNFREAIAARRTQNQRLINAGNATRANVAQYAAHINAAIAKLTRIRDLRRAELANARQTGQRAPPESRTFHGRGPNAQRTPLARLLLQIQRLESDIQMWNTPLADIPGWNALPEPAPSTSTPDSVESAGWSDQGATASETGAGDHSTAEEQARRRAEDRDAKGRRGRRKGVDPTFMRRRPTRRSQRKKTTPRKLKGTRADVRKARKAAKQSRPGQTRKTSRLAVTAEKASTADAGKRPRNTGEAGPNKTLADAPRPDISPARRKRRTIDRSREIKRKSKRLRQISKRSKRRNRGK